MNDLGAPFFKLGTEQLDATRYLGVRIPVRCGRFVNDRRTTAANNLSLQMTLRSSSS
jgi:hypothetical protein